MWPALLLLLFAPNAQVAVQTPAATSQVWFDDFDQAKRVAIESKRDLLVDFTGSDWCKYCHLLKRDVLTKAAFMERASTDYVLVKVDVPRSAAAKALVPDLKRNRELAQQYKIRSWPTLLLMTTDEYVYGRKGYEATDPVSYWDSLALQRLNSRGPLVEAVALAKRFKGADAAIRLICSTRGLALMAQLPVTSPVLPLLVPVVGHYAELDPENKSGDLGRALQILLPSGYSTKDQRALGRKLDPKNELGLYELAVLADAYDIQNERDNRRVAKEILVLDAMGPIGNEQAARVLYTNGALWVERFLRDTPNAKRLARKALPFTKNRPQLKSKLQRLLQK